MRNLMRARTHVLVAAALAGSFSVAAQAEDVRVVVGYHQPLTIHSSGTPLAARKSAPSPQETRCLSTLGSGELICVPYFGDNDTIRQQSRARPGQANTVKKGIRTFSVEAQDPEDVVATLRATGWYTDVALDRVITTHSAMPKVLPRAIVSQAAKAPSDPYYGYQQYFKAPDKHAAGSDFEGASQRLVGNGQRVGVAILDSAFIESDEVSFAGGYDFVTVGDREPNPNYLLEDNTVPAGCSPHGYGVAGVIGAKTDNGTLIAGAADQVDMYAFNVMDCGIGYMSDAAAALRHVAKDSLPGVPDFEGNVTVVNMSLGSVGPDCPFFMQEAIDFATAAGLTVVVASGNEFGDVEMNAPSNCNNIVDVGAVRADGGHADFSNYGPRLNLSAQGIDVVSVGQNTEQVYFWEGTSFATPLVTAAIAQAQRVAPETSPALMTRLTEMTATPFPETDGFCDTGDCGAGILNANALVGVAEALASGDTGVIRHALAGKSVCEQQWYVDHFGAQARLCSLYEVVFLDGVDLGGDIQFELLRQDKSGNFDADSAERLLLTEDRKLMLDNVDLEGYDYYYRLCNDGQCDGMAFALDTTQAQADAKPVACTN